MIKPGDRFLYRVRAGGANRLINVVAKAPPELLKDEKTGQETHYILVFGYGYSGLVKLADLVPYEAIAKEQGGLQ